MWSFRKYLIDEEKVVMAKVKVKPNEVLDELQALGPGLTVEILEQVIKSGEIARDSCTKNDPPSTAGFTAWSTSVRTLRDLLVPQGWERNDEQNFSTVISPNKDIAIAVATGNEATGDETKIPNTKYARGAATQAAIHENRVKFSLFPLPPEDKVKETRTTWILLKRRAHNGDTVYAELSLPHTMTKEGFVESWNTRIILEPILIDPTIVLEDDSTEEIDIPVIRKAK